jgi:hypothetical protein
MDIKINVNNAIYNVSVVKGEVSFAQSVLETEYLFQLKLLRQLLME